MDGPMPDPETLGGEEDDEVPLNIVQERVKLERSASQKIQASPARIASANLQRSVPQVDLFSDEPPARPSTGPPMNNATAPPPPKAQPKQNKPADSLLGLDFFGGSAAATPARPSSTGGATTAAQRTDLKQSILSLYASAPKATPPPRQREPSADLGGLQTPAAQSSSGLGGLNDAFSGLNFSSTSTAQAPQLRKQASPFDSLAGLASPKAAPAPAQTTTSFSGGGSFFDPVPAKSPTAAKPPAPASQPAAPQRGWSSSSGFGDFLSSTSPIVPQTTTSPTSTQTGNQDLFSLMDSTPAPAQPSKAVAPTQPSINSAFNLSNPLPQSQLAQPAQPKPTTTSLPTLSNNLDAWGSNDVWGSESSTTAPAATAQPNRASPAASTSRPTMATGLNDISGGWGASSSTSAGGGWGPSAPKQTPEIAKDDDFGGWSGAPQGSGAGAGAGTGGNAPAKPFAANDDLFSNVWE